MKRTDVALVLDRLLGLLLRSFPQYLTYVRPYIPAGCGDLPLLFDDIQVDQTLLAMRVREQLDRLGALPSIGEFPMDFTDAHDLSIEYLVAQAIRYQQQDIQTLRQISQSLQLAPTAKALVDEALGMAHGHLESLEEC